MSLSIMDEAEMLSFSPFCDRLLRRRISDRIYDFLYTNVIPVLHSYTKNLPSLTITMALNRLLRRDVKEELLGWEPELKHMFGVQKGWVVLDVGASIGQWTLWLSEMVGESGKVISLEPNPSSFVWLCRNVRARKNIRVVRVAAWSKSGVEGFEFLHDPYYSHMSLVSKSKVQTVTIDSLVERLGIGVVDAIKIDVEGAEVGVLQGSVMTLQKTRLVLVEVHNSKEIDYCMNTLGSHGFTVEKIDLRHLLAKRE